MSVESDSTPSPLDGTSRIERLRDEARDLRRAIHGYLRALDEADRRMDQITAAILRAEFRQMVRLGKKEEEGRVP